MWKIIFVFVVLSLFYFKPITVSADSCTPEPNAIITGTHDINYEIGSPEPDWIEGVTAKDSCGNEETLTFDNKKVNLKEEGTYYLYYYASGTSVTVKVNVFEDMTPPVILGAEDFTVEVNSENVDFLRNVTVSDNKDEDIRNKLVIESDKVDLSAVGEYELVYTATDYKKNVTKVTIKVNVVDTTFPILENVKNIELEVKSDISNFDWWKDVTKSDNSNLFDYRIDFGSFDIDHIGNYIITYQVIDGANNKTEKKVKVSVVDQLKPQLKLERELKYKVNEPSVDWLLGLEIIDNYEEIPLENVVVDFSNVNLEVPGTYKIVYFVSDASGNYVTLKKDVIIYDDDTPVIHNVKTIEVPVNTESINYLEGISATDETDTDLTSKIKVFTKNVNLTKVGTYKIFYIVTDRSGNTTIEEVEVKVFDDEGPVINGTKDLEIEVFKEDYNFLEGVSATDNVDTELDINVDISEVNFELLGEYQITYSVIDSNENITEVSVKVTIVDTTKPVFSGISDITIFVGGQVNLLENITATDNYDGDMTSRIVQSGDYDVNKAGEYQIKVEVADNSENTQIAYFKLIVKEQQEAPKIEQNSMYYIVGGIAAVLFILGGVSILTRKKGIM